MHLTFFVTCLIPSTYYVYTAAAEAFYASFFSKAHNVLPPSSGIDDCVCLYELTRPCLFHIILFLP